MRERADLRCDLKAANDELQQAKVKESKLLGEVRSLQNELESTTSSLNTEEQQRQRLQEANLSMKP